MRLVFCLLVLNLYSLCAISDEYPIRRHKDSTNIYQKLDTTYIANYGKLLNVKFVIGVRHNTFGFSNKLTKESLEYGINSKVNFGLAFSYKWLGLEVGFSPKALNQNDALYGKSTQFSLATGGNSRKFIYDIYYRYAEGFHTTAKYKFGSDTVESYYKRPDIYNNNLGFNVCYIFNNKKFSSSAPYSLTQRQKKSAGSMLLGAFGFVYTIDADTIIFPDTLWRQYKPEVQFSSAASTSIGIMCGYTYTFKFWKYWFVNIATIPGVSYQTYYSTNAFDKTNFQKSSGSISLQSKFALGYNRPRFFIGFSYVNNQFLLNSDESASINYKFGAFRFFYGHRFDLSKAFKKKL